MYKKLEQGGYPFMVPVGYKNIPQTQDITIDEEYAPFVRKAFEYFKTGQYSLAALNDQLYNEGFRAKRSKKRPNKEAMKRMLSNPFYYGECCVKGLYFKLNHQPLITKEVFDEVQIWLGTRHKPKMNTKNLPFVGFMTCAHCGRAITGEEKRKKSGQTYVYYHCTGNKRQCQNVVYVEQKKIEAIFDEAVGRIQIPDDVVELTKKALIESQQDQKEYHASIIRKLNREYTLLQTMIEKCYEDKLLGKIEHDFWEQQNGSWKNKQREIMAAIEHHNLVSTKYHRTGIELLDLAKNINRLYLSQPIHEKRKLLKIVLSNC